MTSLLKDKVCIVTGAGRGIGKEIAMLFASEGAMVVVNERRSGTASEWVDNCPDRDRLDGYDISEDSIKSVPGILKKEKSNRFTSIISELDLSYDMVVVCNVLHHIPIEQRADIINILFDHLSQTGILIVIEHNMLNPLTRKSVYDCPFDANAHMLSVSETLKLLKEGGFFIKKRDYITFFPPKLSKLRRFDKYLWWMPLGAQYLICASKTRAGVRGL